MSEEEQRAWEYHKLNEKLTILAAPEVQITSFYVPG